MCFSQVLAAIEQTLETVQVILLSCRHVQPFRHETKADVRLLGPVRRQ
jgi:hypothetical protein